MKTWKLLKSLSDKDAIVIGKDMLKFGDFLNKLKTAIYNSLSGQNPVNEALKNQGFLSVPQDKSIREFEKNRVLLSNELWIDGLYVEEDKPTLLEILNNPELVSDETLDSEISDYQKMRLRRKKYIVSDGMKGELMQIGEDWKPCKVVVKMHLEVYVEEEDPPAPVLTETSPLDDIRQAYGNLNL